MRFPIHRPLTLEYDELHQEAKKANRRWVNPVTSGHAGARGR